MLHSLEQPSGLHQVPPLQPRLPLLLGGDDPARLEEALAGKGGLFEGRALQECEAGGEATAAAAKLGAGSQEAQAASGSNKQLCR